MMRNFFEATPIKEKEKETCNEAFDIKCGSLHILIYPNRYSCLQLSTRAISNFSACIACSCFIHKTAYYILILNDLSCQQSKGKWIGVKLMVNTLQQADRKSVV